MSLSEGENENIACCCCIHTKRNNNNKKIELAQLQLSI